MFGGKIGIPELIALWLLMMDLFSFLFMFGLIGVAAARTLGRYF